MEAIEKRRIIGIKILKDDGKYDEFTYCLPDNDKWRVIQFDRVEDIDNLIEDLNFFKEKFIEKNRRPNSI